MSHLLLSFVHPCVVLEAFHYTWVYVFIDDHCIGNSVLPSLLIVIVSVFHFSKLQNYHYEECCLFVCLHIRSFLPGAILSPDQDSVLSERNLLKYFEVMYLLLRYKFTRACLHHLTVSISKSWKKSLLFSFSTLVSKETHYLFSVVHQQQSWIKT